VADHFRLLVDFLGHEMIVAGLVNDGGGGRGDLDLAVGGAAFGVEDLHVGALDDGDIAFFQIGDAVGEGRQREGVGAEIGFGLGITHGQGRALAGADQQAFMVLEDHRQGIGASQPRHRLLRRFGGVQALVEIVGDEMGGDFGVGLGFKRVAALAQFVAQVAEILDDAVMDDRDAAAGVRMGIGLGGGAMGGPAGMADAGTPAQRAFLQHFGQLVELPGRAAALDGAIHQGGDAGAVIAAIFQAAQRLDQDGGHFPRARDADNAAHFTFSPCWRGTPPPSHVVRSGRRAPRPAHRPAHPW
jgi:hypothetical protein